MAAIVTPRTAGIDVSTDEQQTPGGDARNPEPHNTPRWVKVFGGLMIIALLLFLLLMLTGGPGRHGPRRHLGAATSPAPHALLATAPVWPAQTS
jgi:hypothetical protein